MALALSGNRLTTLVIACAVLSLSACQPSSTPEPNTTAAPSAAPLPEVVVVVAQQQAVERRTQLAGRLRAYQVADVRPQASGIIQKRLFEEGSLVRAGQPLYQLDSATAETAVRSADALLRRQQANLNALKVKAQRYQNLIGLKAVSQQEYDDILAQIALAQADIAANQAALASSKINLDYSVVRAPIGGQTGTSNVTVGALVTANQATPLLSIQQLDRLYVDITQSSAQLLALRQQIAAGNLAKNNHSAAIHLTLADGSKYPIAGRLQFSNAAVDESTGSVTLRAVIDNPDGLLLSGMYVTAEVDQGTLPNAMLIPQQAVTRTPQGEAMVLVVANDGSVSQRTINAVATQGDQWVVSDGLQNGEKVIVQGSQKIRLMPNMPAPKVKSILADAVTAAAPATPPSTAATR